MDGKFSSPSPKAYVGFANLPNQVHRKSVKKGFQFTMMICGASGLGKTTLVNSLFPAEYHTSREIPQVHELTDKTVSIEVYTQEIKERDIRGVLTIVDTPGFGDSINGTDSYFPIIEFIETKFQDYLKQESGVNRRNIIDERVHALLYVISSCGRGLKPLDIEFLQSVHTKVNIIPVIGFGDALTPEESEQLKMKILQQLAVNEISYYRVPDPDEDEDDQFINNTKALQKATPFAVIGSTEFHEIDGRQVRARQHISGHLINIEEARNCDFALLRHMLVVYMSDLQDITIDTHYELYRATQLQESGALDTMNGYFQDPNDVLAAKDAQLELLKKQMHEIQLKLARQSGEAEQDRGLPRSSKSIHSRKV